MALCKAAELLTAAIPTLVTLKEYLEDYARTGATYRFGADPEGTGQHPNERIRHIAVEHLEKIAAGQRDFRF
ncbi:MAG: hypothetical protein ACLT2T_12030 [Bilophila wadsworthia]